MIERIKYDDDFKELTGVLNKSHKSIAEQFNLTKENSPTNPAFLTSEQLKAQFTDFREFYKLVENNILIGLVVIEQSQKENNLFFIERLSVLPEYRHKGYGRILMQYAENRIKELKGKKISLGVIHENIVLTQWYSTQGYSVSGLKKFDHLPFTVCFMEKNITG